jgi:hypothetical protein
MERRPFLALLTAAVAGCSSTEPSTPTVAPTEVPTDTPTETPAPTDTPTATATETPTPTAAESAIDEVRSTLGAVLAQYRGPGETILATDASATGFDDRQVEIGVQEAKRELGTAREEAATERQEQVVERLDTVRRFLGTAAETQVGLVGAYRRAQNVRGSLAAENGTAARESIHEMDIQRQIARGPYRTMIEETNAGATEALSGLDASTYQAKREQFDAEIRAFGALRGPLDTFAGGIGQLEAAVAIRRNGSTARAERTAERAADQLDSASASLTTVTERLGSPADSLIPLSRTLSDLAATKAASTRERFELDSDDADGDSEDTGGAAATDG